MDNEREGAVWMSSYPKSGNTWLRCLLEAYRRNGIIDINDLRISAGDGGSAVVQSVSPVPIDALGFRGQMQLRPAAVLNLVTGLTKPTWIKTHFANIQPDGLPHCIPKDFTNKAVYVVRDPRSVLMSFSNFFKTTIEESATAMGTENFTIGGEGEHAIQLISSWSNHVASWVSERNFPVHVVKYEDMVKDTNKELTEVMQFLGQDVNVEIVSAAVKAVDITKLRKSEKEFGFNESSGDGRTFFNDGGTRWESELENKWIEIIEKDHGDVMRAMGYLEPIRLGLTQ